MHFDPPKPPLWGSNRFIDHSDRILPTSEQEEGNKKTYGRISVTTWRPPLQSFPFSLVDKIGPRSMVLSTKRGKWSNASEQQVPSPEELLLVPAPALLPLALLLLLPPPAYLHLSPAGSPPQPLSHRHLARRVRGQQRRRRNRDEATARGEEREHSG